MDVFEVARSLGLTPSGVRNQLGVGALAGAKVDGRWVVTTEDVERYRRERLGRHDGAAFSRPDVPAARLAGLRTPETKAKMRAAKVGRTLAPDHVAKISAALSARVIKDETRAKHRDRQLGIPKSDAHKAALRSAAARPEVRAKRSAMRRGSTQTAEARARISRAKTGVKMSAATRERNSLAVAAAYRDGRRTMSHLERLAWMRLEPEGFQPFPWIAGHTFDFGRGSTVIEVHSCRLHDHRLVEPSCPKPPFGKADDRRIRDSVAAAGLTLVELWECQRERWGEILAPHL